MNTNSDSISYVLITPVRNGAATIEHTVKSVLSQTMPPKRWLIVDDGSSDQTVGIVKRLSANVPFISLVQRSSRQSGDFSSKVAAFNYGLQQLHNEEYDFIGNLDADVSFQADYFSEVLAEFRRDERLGLAGGTIVEIYNGRCREMRISGNSVPGAVQLFRRACFDEIQGYQPLRRGGIDSLAEIQARMKKWHVKLLPHLKVSHHGPVLTGQRGFFRSRFNQGINRYLLGYHPLFHIAASFRKSADPPFLIGGMAFFLGYFWAAAFIRQPAAPGDAVQFLRKEQIARLKQLLNPPRV